MTFASDIADDYLIFDGLEDVILTPQNIPATAITGVKALRRARNYKTIQLFGDVNFEPSDVPFILFVGSAANPSLQGAIPKNGDKITDAAGVAWTIKQVTQQTMQSRYTCLCRQQV